MTAPQTVAQADEAIKAGNNKEGERILKSILSNQSSSTDDAFLKEQEASLLRLGELYRDTKDANALAETVCSSRTFMSNIAKAKTAKLVHTLTDYFEDIPGSRQTQIQVTKENEELAKSEKRIFL